MVSKKKESLTGAVTAIKADEIATTKTENLISNIQGKMPGLLIRQRLVSLVLLIYGQYSWIWHATCCY